MILFTYFRQRNSITRPFGSKDWLSWSKAKPTNDIRTTKWSMLNETEPQQTQNIDDTDQLDQNIIECFHLNVDKIFFKPF